MGLLDFSITVAVPVFSAFATVVMWAEFRGVSTKMLGVFDFALLAIATATVALSYATLFAVGRNRHQFAPGA